MEKEQFDQLIKLLKQLNENSIEITNYLSRIDATLDLMDRDGIKLKGKSS